MTPLMQRIASGVFQHHRPGLRLSVYLAAGAMTGVACVAFMWLFEFMLRHHLDPARAGLWQWLITPVVFVALVELIRRTAPCADGAGIPQVVFASIRLDEASYPALKHLVSLRTMAVKIFALLVGVWAGASTGREGPTVHVAACLFLGVLLIARRLLKLQFDLRSGVIAGGAAGLAAAFNTPLAGVTFAIEELSGNYFTTIKEFVLMTIIVAGVAAKSLTGEYAYFGRLAGSPQIGLGITVLIAIAGGLAGAAFSTLLTHGRQLSQKMGAGKWRYALPALLACALLLMNALSSFSVLGPGNEAAQALVAGEYGDWVAGFSFYKAAATLFTYWAGMAGGIFAPCLSIGASLGSSMGAWLGWATSACAMIGMAAFLSGTIQAPMTSFVIIFEMTGHHQMLLPVMLAALIATLVAKAVGAKHLYQTLAASYGNLLGSPGKLQHAS